MDVTTLRAVLAELRPQLLPSRFEKAQQPSAHNLQLGFRALDGRHWLELSWWADAPRLLPIDPPARRGEGSTLAQQLQHGLGGLALVAIDQHGWERVVELGFAPRPGEAICRTLVVELMGRHSNLFLLDGQRRVVALGRQVKPNESRLRPIASGDTYSPPPPLQADPPDAGEALWHWRRRLQLLPLPLGKALLQSYQGISPALALQLAGDHPDTSTALLKLPVEQLSELQWSALWVAWQQWLGDLAADRFGFVTGGATAYRCWGAELAGPVGRPLAQLYDRQLTAQAFQLRHDQLQRRLFTARDRQSAQRAEQQALLEQAAGCDQLRRQADALLCLADPSREQVAEAQALYKKARRLQRSSAVITTLLERHDLQLERIEASLAFLELHRPEETTPHALRGALEDLAALEDDVEELLSVGGRERDKGRSKARARRQPLPCQPLEFLTAGGLRVQVGRNHRQNEWISLRQARRGDLWFHAQECPGSHVMLKSSEAPATDADLQAAADLAARFSRARGNARVPVVMVPSDQLQRIAGAGPGTVRHRGGEVVWGDPGRGATLCSRSLGSAPAPAP
jgi:predicted ribosome quality control (RQC) complex YloA/Tae2 family protein